MNLVEISKKNKWDLTQEEKEFLKKQTNPLWDKEKKYKKKIFTSLNPYAVTNAGFVEIDNSPYSTRLKIALIDMGTDKQGYAGTKGHVIASSLTVNEVKNLIKSLNAFLKYAEAHNLRMSILDKFRR